jgi:hypothetical protein
MGASLERDHCANGAASTEDSVETYRGGESPARCKVHRITSAPPFIDTPRRHPFHLRHDLREGHQAACDDPGSRTSVDGLKRWGKLRRHEHSCQVRYGRSRLTFRR